MAVRTTSTMSSAMLSVPSVIRQPARSSASMRAARPRRAAMAGLTATTAPAAPSVTSSSPLMQRQCAAMRPVRAGRSARRTRRAFTPRCSRIAHLAPDWLRWMVATVSSSSCSLRTRPSNSGEQRSGDQRGDADAHAPVDAAVPARVQVSDPGQAALRQRRVPARTDPAARPTSSRAIPLRAHTARAAGRYRPAPPRSVRGARLPRGPAWCRCGSLRARRSAP